MRQFSGVFLLTSLGLAVVAGAIAAGDRSVFVPPPEAVAENFGRQLATHRFDRALPQTSRSFRQRVGVDALRDLARKVERGGRVDRVESEPLLVESERAEAIIRFVQGRSTTTLRCGLVRESGLWLVDDVSWRYNPASSGEVIK